jgi:hypothetical protein
VFEGLVAFHLLPSCSFFVVLHLFDSHKPSASCNKLVFERLVSFSMLPGCSSFVHRPSPISSSKICGKQRSPPSTMGYNYQVSLRTQLTDIIPDSIIIILPLNNPIPTKATQTRFTNSTNPTKMATYFYMKKINETDDAT